MQENEGETSKVIMWPQPLEGPSTEEGTGRPTKRRRVQPDEASGTQGRLCRSCQALKLDDRSSGAPVSSLGDTCTSPFPEYLEEEKEEEDEDEEEEDEDGLTFKFIPLNYTREDTLPDLPTLSQSERDGCGFCAVLIIAARREYYSLQWSTDSLETPRLIISGAEYALEAEYGPTCLGIHMEFHHGHELCSMTIPFQVACFEGECATWLKTRYRPLERDPLSEKTGTILRSWLHECHDSHTGCTPEGASGRLPTRLLDVGGSTLNEAPRLILSADELESRTAIDTHYAALSHCWGKGTRPLKTETFSISHRLQEIPLDSMPPTYRDAIMLTRSLRIRYLWIDSLCIIQDDKADWEKESAIMFDVYRNAHVTLCALVTSCDDGFLPQARRRVEIPFRSSVNSHVHGSLSLNEIWPLSTRDHWYSQEDGWEDHYEQSEWNKRGWTFQEMQFSPRRLICGLQQFHFDCDTMGCSEDDPIPDQNYGSSLTNRFDIYDPNDVPDIYRDWYDVLSQYTIRSLTFAQDRLPAVSSLAAAVAGRTEDRFIAGLWEADLLRGLFWKGFPKYSQAPFGLSELIERLTDPEIFVAPSWSWACLQIPKEWIRTSTIRIPRLQVIEAHTQVDGGNPFGRVAKAHLIVRGKLLPVHDFSLDRSESSWDYTVTSSKSFIAKWGLDWILTDEEVSLGLFSGGCGLKKETGLFMLPLFTLQGSKDGDEVTAESYNEWHRMVWDALRVQQVGLVLCSTASRDEYLRIGTFETIDWEEGGSKLFKYVPEREIKLV